MKEKLSDLLKTVIADLFDRDDLLVEIVKTKSEVHGDWSSNIAMILANELQENPKELARKIISSLPDEEWIEKIELAGPGFINFFLTDIANLNYLKNLLQNEGSFYPYKEKTKKNILIEYVSSNPTGPLHIGHGRGAALGSSLSNLLKKSGNEVSQEYYVNDQGLQTKILADSVHKKYLEKFEIDTSKIDDANFYKGEYIDELAAKIKIQENDTYIKLKDEKKFIDLIIKEMMKNIKMTLEKFKVNFDSFYSESSLYKKYGSNQNKIQEVLKDLKGEYSFKSEGAIWFKSTQFGDDKDRVLIRSDDQETYFLSDIAYHKDKFSRGYDEIINIWGSDHHGYLPRIIASINALKLKSEKLKTFFIQFVSLIKKGHKTSMSTRAGDFVTLDELIEEVGVDAARFFYLAKKSDQALEFDMDLAVSQDKNNPVYYIQYAFARICSLEKELKKRKMNFNVKDGINNLDLLNKKSELEIISFLENYKTIIEQCNKNYEVHPICFYLRDLASKFHSYYNSEIIIDDEEDKRNAKFTLLLAVKKTIKSGMDVLMIETPEKM
jgi:arginyl-tRNA synthetase